jgi:hypothetical protein
MFQVLESKNMKFYEFSFELHEEALKAADRSSR